ncbi:dihydropteroate synthase [Paracraurococcus ruber]|uniref:dihydropteroate synthase n=1 Tax=Paracraurococcus ruber TaxID=77675 RepID=A0ABS1D3H3_9PROT|nr:dihydropteroate synthase [Paracraurococcus ruber]MBK1660996.1 dihydropteroate synthase [Paracraurococcus ruber]TDG21405.1 dihydropteroate synthase [Paracraurococcus ruber]
MRWIEPLALLDAPLPGTLPLQGGPRHFALARLIEDGAARAVLPAAAIPPDWQDLLPPLVEAPLPFAGLPAGRPLVMGIVNVTPDSFSGDGVGAAAAIARGEAMLAAGADILDIGGESTRPGADPVPPEEECRRILPVLRALAPLAPVSVDTRHAATMAAALAAGARIVNDVTALRHDPGAVAVVRDAGVPVAIMHMPGTDPRTMQAAARYDDVVLEVAGFLRDRVAALEAAGIPRHRIAVDPGIGFGKTIEHNLALLERLPLLAGIGCPLLVGLSRKRFLGTLAGIPEAGQRVVPSIAGALFAVCQGAAILRVHDVAETVQALAVWRAAASGHGGPREG